MTCDAFQQEVSMTLVALAACHADLKDAVTQVLCGLGFGFGGLGFGVWGLGFEFGCGVWVWVFRYLERI